MGSGDVAGTGSGLYKGTAADRCSVFMHQKQNQGAGVCREKGSTGGEEWETRGGLRCRATVRRRLPDPGVGGPLQERSGALAVSPAEANTSSQTGLWPEQRRWGQTAHRTGCGLGRGWWGNERLQRPCPRL